MDWQETAIWSPSRHYSERSTLSNFIKQAEAVSKTPLKKYNQLHQWSTENPAVFWELIAEQSEVHWHCKPTTILSNESKNIIDHRWFINSKLNYSERILNNGADDSKVAIIFRDESTSKRIFSYGELRKQVHLATNALIRSGIKKGDRICAIMPNQPETVILFLATAAIGAIWSSCAPEFGSAALLDRFKQISPKILLTVTSYHYASKVFDLTAKIATLQKELSSLQTTVWVNDSSELTHKFQNANNVAYQDWINKPLISEDIQYQAVPFNHPLYILYSSGTTGKPKCIVHGHGGPLLQHWKELALHTNITSEDVLFYYTTCGWMMWNWMLSSLMLQSTIVLYHGDPFYHDKETSSPSKARHLWDIVEQENVTVFGVSASYLITVEQLKYHPIQNHRLEHLKTLLSTGSPLPEHSFDFVNQFVGNHIQLSSISGGTDIVSCFALGCPILPVYRGQIQCIGLGMDVAFVDDNNQEQSAGLSGELVCKQSVPSMPVMFWNDPDKAKYHASYFNKHPDVWTHGDFGFITAQGGVVITGRADAVLNPGGVRIGTAEIYRNLREIPSIVESIAVSYKRGAIEQIILFVKLKLGNTLDTRLQARIKETLRNKASPRHVPAEIIAVPDLPKTLNGKLSELAVKTVIEGKKVNNIEALINPESLDYFKDVMV